MGDPRWTVDEDGYLGFTWDESTWDILDVADGVVTPRRVVLYTTTLALSPLVAMWVQHARDHLCGWYDR